MLTAFERRAGEDAAAFHKRLRGREDGRPRLELKLDACFFAALTDDPAIPRGSEGYALRFRNTSAEQVRRLSASGLVSALKP